MSFGQLTHRESLRDVVTCLNSQESRLYHLGFGARITLTTLTRANEQRDWKIYRDVAKLLIREARTLYRTEQEFSFDIDSTIYALDSTMIDVCLDVFGWAKYRKTEGAVKLHTLLDLRGNIPTWIEITDGKVGDVSILDVLTFEAGAFYVMDRGYIDWERLYAMHCSSAFFVVRAKKNLQFERIYSRVVDRQSGLRCDQTIRLTEYASKKRYPERIRRVKYYDAETGKHYVFLTNNFSLGTDSIATAYKHRWQIELFFRWIKQHLRVKTFWGVSRNAVHTQVWIAICTYVLVAIAKKRLGIGQSLYEMLQILSVSPFEKTPLNELFCNAASLSLDGTSSKQLKLPNI